jgi:hypothetical protein
MKAAVVCVCFLVCSDSRAWNQITSGTIIVIAQAKNRVIIAADSRTEELVNGTSVKTVSDCNCKIAVLGRNTVFAAAGVLSDNTKTWTASSQALAAYSAVIKAEQPVGSVEGELILKSWAEAIKGKLAALPPQDLLAYANSHEGFVTSGVLVGRENDGVVWTRLMRIGFSELEGFYFRGDTLTSVPHRPARYWFVGKTEICMEFNTLDTSKRAIAERARWKQMKLKGEKFDRFKVHRLVELTIMDNPDKAEVGGPIDEIEVDTSGTRWICVKPNCLGPNVKTINDTSPYP